MAAIVLGLGVAAVIPSEAAACLDVKKEPSARVELFRDSQCQGPAVSAGYNGDPNRPDFAHFTDTSGSVFDVDDSRSSLIVAKGSCVRLFDGRDYTGEASPRWCSLPDSDVIVSDFAPEGFNDRASSMRVCSTAAPTECDRPPPPSPPPPPASPPPVPNGSPASANARLRARFSNGRRRVRVAFGRAKTIAVVLATADGQPIAGARLQVFSRALGRGARRAADPEVMTDAAGRARFVVPQGPSRLIRVEYRDQVGNPQPAAVSEARLRVRAAVRLRIRPRHVRADDLIRITGRLAAAPRSRLGKLVSLQALDRRRWRTFSTLRTDRRGRFATRYRFSARARGRFAIRVAVPREPSYPYATGHSRPVRVRVS